MTPGRPVSVSFTADLVLCALVVAAGLGIMRHYPTWATIGEFLMIVGGLLILINFGRAIEKCLTDLAAIRIALGRLNDSATRR